MLAEGGPAGQPVRRIGAVLGCRGGVREQPVGPGLREQRQPELLVLRVPPETGGHDLQQPEPDLRPLLGEDDQHRAVGGPEGPGRADRGGGGEEVGDQCALLRDPGQARRLEQPARVLRQ